MYLLHLSLNFVWLMLDVKPVLPSLRVFFETLMRAAAVLNHSMSILSRVLCYFLTLSLTLCIWPASVLEELLDIPDFLRLQASTRLAPWIAKLNTLNLTMMENVCTHRWMYARSDYA